MVALAVPERLEDSSFLSRCMHGVYEATGGGYSPERRPRTPSYEEYKTLKTVLI
jgi:hypothetical protein